MKNNQLFLQDILSAIESIETFIEGMSQGQLKEDDKTFSAVIRKLEIIGEAAKNISKIITEKHDDVPWKEMAGMRDRLIHAYFGIDCDLVWDVIKNELPRVKEKVQAIIKDTGDRK